MVIADGTSENIDLSVINGNTGLVVRSMQITGPNAPNFSIDAGVLENALLNAGATKTVSVSLSGTGANRSATLVINYGASSTLSIGLTNSENAIPNVTNPGNQSNNESDIVSLQIQASSPNNLTYSASGLPPNLTINPNTGEITGTISNGSGGGNAYNEVNGLVVVEAESGNVVPGWTLTTAGGETGILCGTNSFAVQNGGTIAYDINVTTPGVYRFIWNSFYSGPSSTDAER